ncbi:MAG TPA: hypothetical protein VGM97_21060 [Steroidobacteraceae bacterium]|jgi:error-prone DNA polymerase
MRGFRAPERTHAWVHTGAVIEATAPRGSFVMRGGSNAVDTDSGHATRSINVEPALGDPPLATGFVALELPPPAPAPVTAQEIRIEEVPADWMEETVRVASLCTFSLEELKYEHPREVVPEGATPASHLRKLTYEGAKRR